MKFKLTENIFELLNNLAEDLDPSIDGNAVLYEDNDYSKTPAEADNYRTDTEDVLGFELNGNLVLYLATSWPEFYHNAHKYAGMKDLIISFMKEEGLIDKDQEKAFDLNSEMALDDFDDDIDYEDEENPDVLHPASNTDTQASGGFKPLNVQSWEPQVKKDDTPNTTADDINAMADEYVEDDDFDTEDAEILNNILTKKGKSND